MRAHGEFRGREGSIPLALTAPVPSTVAVVLSRNLTVPVGAPVKVTACPLVEGLGAEVSVVFVFALCTTCVKPGDVLPTRLPFPA